MCEECESDGPTLSYAQKRARMRAYWTPKRKPPGFAAMPVSSDGGQPESRAVDVPRGPELPS